jgi:hypothetical protein
VKWVTSYNERPLSVPELFSYVGGFLVSAVIAAALLTALLHLPVETIGARFGELPRAAGSASSRHARPFSFFRRPCRSRSSAALKDCFH